MKTKRLALLAIAAFIGGVQLSGAQVLSQPDSKEHKTKSILAISNEDDVRSIDSYQSTLANTGPGGQAFSGNLINIGVGFVSGIGNVYSGSGYSSSSDPAMELSYERAIQRFGVGVNASYQIAKAVYSGVEDVYNVNTGLYDPVTFTNTYTFHLLTICARGAYHFSAGGKFDPYAGIFIGYCGMSQTYSTTNPVPSGGTGSPASLNGYEIGGFGGLRYFFSKHIGVWAEVQYGDATFAIPGTDLTVNTNPSTIFNLGLTVKF